MQMLRKNKKYQVSAPRGYVPETVDFAPRISGTSMEPEYHDGQIVWVYKKTYSMIEKLVSLDMIIMPAARNYHLLQQA